MLNKINQDFVKGLLGVLIVVFGYIFMTFNQDINSNDERATKNTNRIIKLETTLEYIKKSLIRIEDKI